MKRTVLWGFFAVLVLGLIRPALAGQAEDTRALVEQALSMFKEMGQKASVAAINDKKDPFRKDGDVYVFAITMDNQLVGHHDHTLRGIKFNDFKDANGLFLCEISFEGTKT
jgi:hypothetical protein